jgi:hypothetical protein
MAARPQLRLADFSFGLRRLAEILASHSDVDRLSDSSAVIGRDFGQLCQLRAGHVRCDRGTSS